MSESNEFSVSAVNRKRAETTGQPAGGGWPAPAQPAAPGSPAGSQPAAEGLALPFDPLRLVGALLKRGPLLLLAAGLLAVLGLFFALSWFDTQYSATAQFMKQDVPNSFRVSEIGEAFRPRQLTLPTLVSLMQSLSLLERVCQHAQTPLSPRALLGGLTITPERNTDLVKVALKTSLGERQTMELLNVFGEEVVRMTRETQAQEAADMNKFLKQQLVKADQDLARSNTELLEFSKEAKVVDADKELDAELRKMGDLDLKYETMRLDYETLDLKMQGLAKELFQHNPMTTQLQAAQTQLALLLNTYTEANPIVQSQRAQVAALEKQMKEAPQKQASAPQAGEGDTVAATLYMELVTFKSQKEVLAAQLKQLAMVRETVSKRLSGLPEKSLQYARIKARQQSLETARGMLASRQREAQLFEEGALGYFRFYEAKPQDVEINGRGKKIAISMIVGAVLGLLMCAVLVCLRESLDDRLKTAADVKRVTRLPLLASLPDMTSWDPGKREAWAFRTWTALQSQFAAGPNQSLVCGLVSVGGGEGRSTWLRLLAVAASQRESRVAAVTNDPRVDNAAIPLAAALTQPACIVQAMAASVGRPVWMIVDKDWQWSAERRRQWQAALNQWQQEGSLVVLVELPLAQKPETSLMAETLPNLIWLAGGGRARGRDTGELLETLRRARCHFVGAVLNREPHMRIPFIKNS